MRHTFAVKKLAKVGARAGALGGKKVSAACATRIGQLVEGTTRLIEGS